MRPHYLFMLLLSLLCLFHTTLAEAKYPLVLVIDDNQINRLLAVETLGLLGDIDTIEADNGHHGLELASKHHPNLILLDIGMPKMDGFEVMQKLKSNPSTSDIPVIAFTAGYSRDCSIYLSAGFNSIIKKPFGLEDFIDRVKKEIDG